MPRGYQRLSSAEVDAIWLRLRAGHAAKPTARALGLPTSTVRAYLVRCGGIRPDPRRRSPGRLSFAEREEISRGLAAGASLRSIAAGLGRAPSTVSREVAAHGGPRRYRAAAADQLAWARATRPKTCKLVTNPALAEVVALKLKRRWSPQQIAGWLKTTYPDNHQMQVSHESIYRTLFVQSRGALRKELTAYLRTGRVIRRPQGVRLPDGRGGRPGDPQHLRTPRRGSRPGGARSLGRRPGLRQTDEPGRHPGRTLHPVRDLLVALPSGNHKADVVADALAAAIQRLPNHLAKSLTWDQGHEMAQHARFTAATGVEVYFCDPKSPWQRGSNENTNGLLRQYLPKSLDFRTLTQTDFDAIALELNERPRQTLGFKSPSQALAEVLR